MSHSGDKELHIRSRDTGLNARLGATHAKASRRSYSRLMKRNRKHFIRYGLLAANVALLVGVIVFVSSSRSSGEAGQRPAAVLLAQDETISNPLDQISSADIAVHVAKLTALPETDAVQNHADSFNTQLSAAPPASETIVAKPQIVADSAVGKSNKDIKTYATKDGDTVGSIAQQFGVSSDSVKWSNSLTSDKVAAGKQLSIPPVPGIVYTVKVGDTPDSLAKQYSADRAKIVAFNDAEVNGLKVGVQIVIPDGVVKQSATSRASSNGGSGSFNWASDYVPVYNGNGYAYGWCTWYVASRIKMPSNWGNAYTWDDRARQSGWIVSSIPRVGAIAQTDARGLGHVGIVEAVSEDGSMIKYSDMNGISGWGRVGYSGWVPVHSNFQRFIYQ